MSLTENINNSFNVRQSPRKPNVRHYSPKDSKALEEIAESFLHLLGVSSYTKENIQQIVETMTTHGIFSIVNRFGLSD